MGIQAMVKHLIAQMKKENATNRRTLAKWSRRAMDIAEKADELNDVACQSKLEDVVKEVATGLGGRKEEKATPIIAPKDYLKRRMILSDADRVLDEIAPPPNGHSEDMQRAMKNDDIAWLSILEELGDADDELLKEVCQLPSMDLPRPTNEGPCREIGQQTLNITYPGPLSSRVESRSYESSESSQIGMREERAHEKLQEKLDKYKQGKREPWIKIEISDMGMKNGEVRVYEIPLKHTFCALADTLTASDAETFVPDFWSKETNPTRNCVTLSGVWWEWQDPSRKVIDAIQKDSHLRIETVYKEAEYVVVLVKKGESEDGIPIDVPRRSPPCAFEYFKQLYPGYTVSKVCRLEGTDASKEVFDYRCFPHKTNPLYVELKPHLVGEEDADTVDIETRTAESKGKGRARHG